ncbi:hypothetical protein [Amycolatopsis sp. GM8]|uniref:hypothetical protein n=1 Tax=Amycolatopsis sp. GM8 TaxID=2896530 RepID=UPI001F45F0B9|nr:hypothetical protein [Amycolatopsis sp. GM8]
MGTMDGTQIYNNFNAGRPEVFQALGDSIDDLNKGYLDEAKAIMELQMRMSQSWTGASGDAASAGAGPLAAAFRDSSVPLDETTNAMSTQTGSLETAKSAVVPVPPAPEKPSGWSTVFKAAIPIVGPSMAVSDIKSYQDGLDKHNTANETNVRVMAQYSSATSSTQSTIPMSYRPLAIDGASVSVKPPELNVTTGHLTSQYVGPTQQSPSSTPSPSGSGPIGSGPVSPPPNVRPTGPVTAVTPPTGLNVSPVTRPPSLPGPGGTSQGGGTGSSGYVPGGGSNSADPQRRGPSGNRGPTGTGGGNSSNSGRNNSAASRLYGTDDENTNRRGTGSGGRGSGSGSGAADERVGRGAGESSKVAENRLGAGKGSGAGNLGNAAAAEQAAAGRGAAKGANGSPMGAAGQRGRGEDDEEHQRPDYLLEADPDSIFGNDIRATPPVIGE